jgi:hypothetical protein
MARPVAEIVAGWRYNSTPTPRALSIWPSASEPATPVPR